MGRHKDPDILRVIEDLKEKGKSIGFEVIDEFKILNGIYYVDLVWTPYKEGHAIFVTFEIEKEDERTLKNTDKIFDTPTSAVEKPYQHFIIIFDGSLSAGDKIIVDEKARRYNIQVFENIKNNAIERRRLFDELDKLKISITGLIEKRGAVNPPETVKETILGIGSISPVVIIENKSFAINQATLTSGSQTFQDRPVLISNTQVFDSKKYKHLALVPIPRETFTLVIPGTSIALDTYKEEQQTSKIKILTFELCDFPIMLKVEEQLGGGEGRFQTKIDPVEADIVQMKKFEELQRSLYNKKKFAVYYQTKKIHEFNGVGSLGYKLDEGWYSCLLDLAFIQEATSVRIPSPEGLIITSGELAKIKMMKNVIQAGFYEGPFEEASISGTKNTILGLIELFQTKGSMQNLKLTFSSSDASLLSVIIPLGDVTYEFKDVTFKDPIETIHKVQDEINPDDEVKIVLIPKSSNVCRAVYSKWSKV